MTDPAGESNREPQFSQPSGFAGMFVAFLFVAAAEFVVESGLFELQFPWWVWLLGSFFMLGISYVEYRNERQQISEVPA